MINFGLRCRVLSLTAGSDFAQTHVIFFVVAKYYRPKSLSLIEANLNVCASTSTS